MKDKLDVLYKTSKRHLKGTTKKTLEEKVGTSAEEFEDGFSLLVMASQLELSKKYKQQARQAQFEEDPSKLDGN